MYHLRYDDEKNRIYIKIKGNMSDEEIKNYADDMMKLIDITSPGFTVLADVTESDISVLENGNKFQNIRNYGATKGFKNVATVVSHEAYERNQKNPYRDIKNIFNSVSEAEDYLDK